MLKVAICGLMNAVNLVGLGQGENSVIQTQISEQPGQCQNGAESAEKIRRVERKARMLASLWETAKPAMQSLYPSRLSDPVLVEDEL